MKTWKLPILSVLAFSALASAQTVYSSLPTAIVGQPVLQNSGTITATAPNLVEGREFFSPQAVAVDTSASPPILYVVDAGNNRILVWKNASGFATGDKADMVIGQRDFLSVTPQGPNVSSATLSSGLSSPTAAVVDTAGNLYVADSGNNRVVRYPSPTKQTGSLLVIDLVLGQKDQNSGAANQGLSAPTANTLALTSGNGALVSGLAIDGANLWVSDSGNNRVLRYNGILIAQNPANDPPADLVLGQADFVTSTLPAGAARNTKNFLQQPSGLAFDQSKRLFVADAENRVSVYAAGASSGSFSARLLGVVLPTQQNPNPPAISASTLGSSTGGPPLGVFTIGNIPYVVDSGNNRILQYPSYDNFPQENIAFSPAALSVFGQPNFFSGTVNAGMPQSAANTLHSPVGGAVANNTLFLADAGNNRVLSIPLNSDGTLTPATRVLGQINFQYNSINLIEGREFGFSVGQILGGSVVIDRNSNPPHLYVGDPLNNRVLGFKDYRTVKAGSTADLVIGQPDFFTAEINYPVNLANQPQATGLSSPQGVALDSSGNLWVADAGNARVLRFPSPFAQNPLSSQMPNLVLGQANFSTKVTDASASTMSVPYGLAFSSDGSVLVSDAALNRVLYFRKPKGGDFSSGAAASTVFGQPGFGPPSETTLVNPRGITIDLDDRLYVANTNSTQVQIVIYPNVGLVQNDPPPVFAFSTATSTSDSLHNPYSIFVDPRDGSFWVADTFGTSNGVQRLLRYPNFQSLSTSAIANASLPSFSPVGVTVDPFGNPIAAEAGTNRVAFFSPGIDSSNSAGGIPARFSGNAANYFQRFAPAMLASIFSYTTNSFGTLQPVNASTLPLPTMLGDLQVTVAGIIAPLLYVSGSQINFQVPGEVQPGSLSQEIRVTVVSTGQVIASGYFRIDATAPGLFTANSTGSGQLAVLNQDNTVNGAANPAKAGSIIQIFGTGCGLVSGNPPDGVAAPGALPTPVNPDVYIGPGLVPATDVSYSGLAPGFVGLWQINVKVPADVGPGDTPLFVIYPSVVGQATAIDQFGNRKPTTIRTAPAQQ